MKIRITGKKLGKAQTGGTKYQYNGRTLDPNNPADAAIIKQQEAGIASDQAAINNYFANKAPKQIAQPALQSSRTPFTAPTSIPNVQPLIPDPPSVNLSGYKPPVVANYTEEPIVAPVDPQEEAAKKANAAYRLKYPNAPINASTMPGLDNQVAQRVDPLGYEMDERIKNDPRYAKKLSRSLKNNNTFKAIGASSDALQKTIGIASAFTGYFDGQRAANEAKSRQRDMQMSDNLFPVTQGSRGDYVQTGSGFGEFRPDQKVVNKGMYTNQFYPAMNSAQFGGTQELSPEMKAMNTVMNNYRGYESVIPEMIAMPVGLGDLDYQPVSNNVSSNNSIASNTSKSVNNAPVNYGKGVQGRIAHNNPGNIHIGGFAEKYGAIPGRPDNNGRVAIFPDMNSGLKAMKDLLFGSSYINLPISKARTRWVGYDNASTNAIVKAMGGDKKLSELSESDKSKLFGEFVKWEDRDVYNYLKSTGAIFKDGGINTNNMKIRITGTPQNMEYGGQKGYGFDNGSKDVYTDMNDNSYDSVSNTIPEVPRDMANIEAEKGETVYGDVDQDGSLEHMNIGGKPHTQGGTPLNVPEGSFIYSNTKKLRIKEPEVLKFFNKSYKTGGFTPAEIAKQYDINKYKAIMDNPFSDELSKKTAYIMLENYQKKLGQLALIQESKKGFPQGIPDIAQSVLPKEMQQESEMQEAAYGGYFAGGGEKDGDYKTKAKKVSKDQLDGYEKVTTEDGKTYYKQRYKVKDAVAGVKGKPGTAGSPEVKGAIPGGTPGKSWENWLKAQLASGVTIDELAKKGHGTIAGLEKYRPFYKPAVAGTPGTNDIEGTPEVWEERYVYTEDPNDIPQVPPVKTPPTFKPKSGNMPFFGYNLLMAPKRYTAYAAPMNAMTPTPTFYDPNRELAANAEIYNQNIQGLNNFGTAQGFMSNASGAAGKAAENAANIMGRYQNMNVGVANQFSPLQTDIMNKVMAYQADRADKVAFNNDQLDKEYRNQQLNRLTAFGRYKANEYDYKTKRNIQNAINPFYQYYDGPGGGNINLRPGVDAYSMITGQFNLPGQNQLAAPTSQQYLKTLTDLRQSNPGLSPGEYARAMSMMPGFSNLNSSRGNSRAMAGMLNQTMAMSPYAASNPVYNRGYDIGDLWDLE